jgi:anti-anti-sigma factor
MMNPILIIDDEQLWGEDIILQLNKSGYKSILALNGNEGIEFAEKHSPSIIFCDISLPDIDGFEVNRELQKIYSEKIPPFVFISGMADLPSIKRRIKALNCEYLTKPFRLKKILGLIDKLVNHNIPSKENIVLVTTDIDYKDNLQKYLLSSNYNFLHADNASSLKNLVSVKNNKFIILDLSLSDKDNLEILNTIKESNILHELHVIVLGRNFDSAILNKYFAEGISDYILKSSGFDEINKALKNLSNKKKISQKVIQNKNANILIVEGDNDYSGNLEYQLKNIGINPLFANNGKQAIKIIKEIKPDFILCDINLPDINGFKLYDELKEQIIESQIPFIFQTGKGDWKDFRKALDSAADGLLVKPYKFKELLNIIKNYIKIDDGKDEVKYKSSTEIENKKDKQPETEKELGQDRIIISTNVYDNYEILIPKSKDKDSNPEVKPDEKKDKINNIKNDSKVLNEVWTETKRIIKKKNTLDYNLEYFLNKHDEINDYEKFIYNDIVIIKLNIRRAVLKEAQQFYKFIFDIILEGYNKFIIDLNNIEFIDSTFIGVLVSALKRISFNRGVLKIVCNPEISSSNYVLFNGLQNIFEVSYNMREVIDTFQQNLIN